MIPLIQLQSRFLRVLNRVYTSSQDSKHLVTLIGSIVGRELDGIFGCSPVCGPDVANSIGGLYHGGLTKELMTLLEEYLPVLTSQQNLLWRTGSATAFTYIVRQGGTLSLPLLQLVMMILDFAHAHRVSILWVFQRSIFSR